jgi:hypothetical protein
MIGTVSVIQSMRAAKAANRIARVLRAAVIDSPLSTDSSTSLAGW